MLLHVCRLWIKAVGVDVVDALSNENGTQCVDKGMDDSVHIIRNSVQVYYATDGIINRRN